MNQENFPVKGKFRWLSKGWWLALFLLGLGLIAVGYYLATKTVLERSQLEHMLSEHLISYANLLLFISAVLYVAHLWFKARTLGIWATSFSALGAVGLVSGLIIQSAEIHLQESNNHLTFANHSEVMALFSAITVILYLMMEKIYGTRSAGAFVMPIVATAVLFDVFGKSNNQGNAESQLSILISYSIHANALANFIAYCAFSVAAALAIFYLWRQHNLCRPLAKVGIKPILPDLTNIEKIMNHAISLGFLLLAFSAVLGMFLSDRSLGKVWVRDTKEIWTLGVLLVYATYLYFSNIKKWQGTKMAYWAVLGFCFILLYIFV